jgi:endonuclease/exonuclease/phosphatase family metal-dependent hydrolase
VKTGELRIATFNIRYGTAPDGPDAWPGRRPRTLAALTETGADLIGLQEALDLQLDAILDAMPGYGCLGVGRDDGLRQGEHAAILYRTDRLAPVDSGTFWFSDTPDVPGSRHPGNGHPRICTWARFGLAEGGRLDHYNVHIDNASEASRDLSVRQLLEAVAARQEQLPALVTGDFNVGEGSAAVESMRRSGFRDTFREIHPDAEHAGTFCGFTDQFGPDKLDYIWVGAGIDVVDAAIVRRKIEGRWPSDHAIVTARIMLT